jgi:hypothetical protein
LGEGDSARAGDSGAPLLKRVEEVHGRSVRGYRFSP